MQLWFTDVYEPVNTRQSQKYQTNHLYLASVYMCQTSELSL